VRVVRTRLVGEEPWIVLAADKRFPALRVGSGALREGDELEVHSTYLEAWTPTTVDGLLEIAGHKIFTMNLLGTRSIFARGLLRNISDGAIRECVVSLSLTDKEGRTVAEKRSDAMTVGPLQIVEFRVQLGTLSFEGLASRVTFTDAKGAGHQSEPIPLVALPGAP